MKDYIFKQKRQTSVWPYIAIILLSLFWATGQEKKTIEAKKQINSLQAENKQLREQSYHMWVMDESCSKQLLNSADGILRVKISK